MRHLFTPLFSLALMFVASAPVTATPSPAIITNDQLIAANDRSVFVLRSITIHPGSYYRRGERVDLLELSAWDGTIRATCILREVEYTADPNTEDLHWTTMPVDHPPCDLAQPFVTGDAALPLPAPSGAPFWPLTLTDNGVSIQRGPDTPPTPLADHAYVDSRARAMSQVTGVTLRGQEQVPGPLCPYCEATYGLPLTQACSLAPQAIEIRMAPWVFLKLTCWTGDGDISGASLFIPVSRKTYDGAHAQ